MNIAVEVLDSGQPAVTADWFVELEDSVVLQFSGADAGDFLQGQFCNDLSAIEVPGSGKPHGDVRAQLSGYCTPKGRLLALFTIYSTGSEADAVYRLIVPVSVAETLKKRLAMFVMRAKVKVESLDNSTKVFGVHTASLPDDILEKLGVQSSSLQNPSPNTVWSCAGLSLIAMPVMLGHHWLLVVDASMSEEVNKTLQASLTPVSESHWESAGVRAGLPVVTGATSDKLIPQMLNLQAVNGLSFNKGCYPGQEIVARMQYLGKLKRRMFLLELTGNTVPVIGADVFTEVDKDLGVVVRSALTTDGRVLALAVLKVSYDAKEIRIDGIPGAEISILELPYAVVEYRADE